MLRGSLGKDPVQATGSEEEIYATMLAGIGNRCRA